MRQSKAVLALGGLIFAVLATLNAAGYRYGVADQAFYVPAILERIDPALFPRDGRLIGSQSRLLILDEVLAGVRQATGLPISWLFLSGYVATMAVLYGALVALGRTLYAQPWTVAALVFAATLRHRITKTGANTLEGHFHPRMLAFGVGLFALVAVLRKRPLIAGLLVILAGVLHPTTAVFFAVWVGVALAVNEPRLTRPLAAIAAAGAMAGILLIASGMLSLAPMDDAWVVAFVEKDYVFPTEWSVGSWLVNLLLPVLIVIGYLARRRAGVAHPHEGGIVAGCLALVAVFLITLPFVAFRSALVVQFQVSRVFWMADLLATVYVIWAIAEAGKRRKTERALRRDWRAPALAIVLAVVAAARGWYVLTVEHPGRPLLAVDLPDDAWRDVSRWLRDHTPKDAHVLADPGHAWKFGSSLRVSAERDVFLEDVKDASIGFYDRRIAQRVVERRAAIAGGVADFFAARAPSAAAGTSTPPPPDGPVPQGLRELASRYDLQYVVSERPLPFPEVYRNARFRVYRLASTSPSSRFD